jgi:hypothetical protein
MVSGEDADRILLEVFRGKVTDPGDTPEQAEYRREIVESVRKIHANGDSVEMPKELP